MEKPPTAQKLIVYYLKQVAYPISFFGIKLTNDVSSSEILNILDSPNKPEHQYEITLDLDPSTIFAHDFYAFSGLILDCQEERPQAEIQKNANRLHITQKKTGPSK